LGAVGLAFLSGVLSTLSPCVLPLLPLVLGAAASERRMGLAALAAGVGLSFAVLGLLVATIGFSIGLDNGAVRLIAAVLMIAVGIALVVPSVQARFAIAGGPIANWADQRLSNLPKSSVAGQFGMGILLGAGWSPCVGPTLGAASLLAARGTNLTQVSVTMLVFGLGAAVPLLVIGVLSREVLVRRRELLLATSTRLKAALGVLLALVGIAIVTGVDRPIEAGLVEASPQWLTALTTRF
jgi:cytochrome c-type biogenesis protein